MAFHAYESTILTREPPPPPDPPYVHDNLVITQHMNGVTHYWLPCRNACILVLSNGFSVGCIISVLLHLALPFDAVDNVDADSASAVSTHVNPTSEGDITHQKVCATQYSITYCCPYANGSHVSSAMASLCNLVHSLGYKHIAEFVCMQNSMA